MSLNTTILVICLTLDVWRLVAQVSDILVLLYPCSSILQTTTFIKQSLTQNNTTSNADGLAKYLPFQTLQTLQIGTFVVSRTDSERITLKFNRDLFIFVSSPLPGNSPQKGQHGFQIVHFRLAEGREEQFQENFSVLYKEIIFVSIKELGFLGISDELSRRGIYSPFLTWEL